MNVGVGFGLSVSLLLCWADAGPTEEGKTVCVLKGALVLLGQGLGWAGSVV